MTPISVLGGGAFGTSLSLALSANGTPVTLWSRDEDDVRTMNANRRSGIRLSGHHLPESLVVSSNLEEAKSDIILLAIPMQKLGGFLSEHNFGRSVLVACWKGVDLQTGLGPVSTVRTQCPNNATAILTGPSFAADIAKGLPTALTLAADNDEIGESLQSTLSRPNLRLYLSSDVVGAELGGALKNVIGLAAGMAIGAGFGDSARASVIARGFAEMTRYATSKGARSETLQGLSGLGDLVLTCTSEKSRNFSAGVMFGSGKHPGHMTIEGIPTASAIATDAEASGVSMPITEAVAAVTRGEIDVTDAVTSLLSRPATRE